MPEQNETRPSGTSMRPLRPKQTSFLFDRISTAAPGVVFAATACAIAAQTLQEPALFVLAGLLVVGLAGLTAWTGQVAWTKEHYEVHDDHLVAHSGGVASDRTLTLDLKKVTHVKQRLPWFRYRFFDVGDVIVESAGSTKAEVVFRSVEDPDGLTATLRGLLQENGFALGARNLIRRETPSTLGTLIECGSIGFGAGTFLAWASLGATGIFVPGATDGVGLLLVALGGLLAFSGLGCWLVLHFFDLKQRTYEVFDDVVEYREGFLSRTNAFIPFENLADASTKQTFVDQVLGLYDVKVSCQGSGSEVSFRRLAGGKEMQAALRSLVDGAQARRALALQETQDSEEATSPLSPARPPAQQVPADQLWTADLRMQPLRALLGKGILRALGTKYTVGNASVASRYELIGQQQLEFAYDKVTGVQVRTGPLDALFGTFTVRIWSIGSATPLDLAHVQRSAINLPALLRQAGVPGGAVRATLLASPGPGVWLRAHPVALITALVVLATSVALSLATGQPAALLGLLFILLWALACPIALARARRQVLTLHDHHVEHRSGIFFRRHVYARYDDVKKLEVRRYLGGTAGHLRVYLAGETAAQTKNGKSAGITQNSFTAHYLPDVTPLPGTLDRLLLGELPPEEVLVENPAPTGQEYRPALANALVPLVLLGLPLPPLLLLIPGTVLGVLRRVYRIEARRVVREEGVLSRNHTSVLFDRIDSLDQGQGLVGKVFKNGTVTLMTAGSSRPDLVLRDTPSFQELHQQIRTQYGR